VHEHEREAVELGERREHLADVVSVELMQEVDVNRVRVRERILVGDLPEEREFVDLAELHLFDAAASLAPQVTAAVDEDAREPFAAGLLILQSREATIGAQEALLDDVLGVLADQPSCETVETRELALGEDSESLGRLALAVGERLRSHNSTAS
jgi:hypothetical protein